MRKTLYLVVATAFAALAMLAVACGGDDEASQVEVSLAEWSVAPIPADVNVGEVTFVVTNNGSEPHQMVVVKSDLPPDGLPVADGKVLEDQIDLIDEIEPFAVGETQRLTLNLSAGNYLLICNIVALLPDEPPESHYEAGMTVSFVVNP